MLNDDLAAWDALGDEYHARLAPAGMFFDNVVLAVKSGCPISLLNCKHFPLVSAAGMLASTFARPPTGTEPMNHTD